MKIRTATQTRLYGHDIATPNFETKLHTNTCMTLQWSAQITPAHVLSEPQPLHYHGFRLPCSGTAHVAQDATGCLAAATHQHVSAEDSAGNLEATQQWRRQAAQSVTAAPPSSQTLPPTTARATCNSDLPPVMRSERRMHLQNAGPSVVRAHLLLASHLCRVFVSDVLVHARRKVWTFQQYDINRRRSTVVHPAHLKTFLNEGQMRD